jgi:2-polyprenyl-3-methyl-5-hydroxy-6-metoxy-1,4-benzoquinol methylase
MDDPLKKAKEKAAATYDAAADHFDDEPLSFWDRVGNRTVANLKLHAGAKVLDVGCGTGASALPAAQAVGKNGSVVGVDLVSRLLDRARAKALAAGLGMVGVLAFGHTRSAEAINIERDLIWILHVKKAPLGKFAGEVWINPPKLGESSLQFI